MVCDLLSVFFSRSLCVLDACCVLFVVRFSYVFDLLIVVTCCLLIDARWLLLVACCL